MVSMRRSGNPAGMNDIDSYGMLSGRAALRATTSISTNHSAPGGGGGGGGGGRNNRSLCQSLNLSIKNNGRLTQVHTFEKRVFRPQFETQTPRGQRECYDGKWWHEEDDDVTHQV